MSGVVLLLPLLGREMYFTLTLPLETWKLSWGLSLVPVWGYVCFTLYNQQNLVKKIAFNQLNQFQII